MILKTFFLAIMLFLTLNCSSNLSEEIANNQNEEIIEPEIKYIQAKNQLDKKKYDEALIIFREIEKFYPLSNEAIQSQIMIGFIEYLRLDYDAAIITFSKIIKKYPSLKNIDYVYYIRALCYYEQISHEELDGEYNILALENLNQILNRFPNSEYAKDSYQKTILVKSNIAAKHMSIARFYQKKKKFTAALNRYKVVVDEFSETKFTPEALYRISEIYLSIGMINESTKTASVLGHNYPNSEWYKFSYDNLTHNKDKTFLNRLGNFFNK